MKVITDNERVDLGVDSVEVALKAARGLMVDELDELRLELDPSTAIWYLMRCQDGRTVVVSEGVTFDDLLWNLRTSIHPKASEDRVRKRAQRARTEGGAK